MLLALDLSTKTVGYAVFEVSNPVQPLLYFGSWNISRTKKACQDPWLNQAQQIKEELLTLLEYHDINAVIVEDIYCGANMATYKTLSRIQGVVALTLAEAGIKQINFIMPSSWRRLLTEGTGVKFNFRKRQDCKESVSNWVKSVYPSYIFKSDDETDAIGIGFSAYLQSKSAIIKQINAKEPKNVKDA